MLDLCLAPPLNVPRGRTVRQAKGVEDLAVTERSSRQSRHVVGSCAHGEARGRSGGREGGAHGARGRDESGGGGHQGGSRGNEHLGGGLHGTGYGEVVKDEGYRDVLGWDEGVSWSCDYGRVGGAQQGEEIT